MATGFYDDQGIWIFGEDDPASPFSDTLNLGMESVSTALQAMQAELASVRAENDAMRDRPLFRAYKSAHHDVPSGASSGVGSMTVDYAEGTWTAPEHSSIRQVPVSGYYRITAACRFQATTNAGQLQLTIRRNATDPQNPATGDPIAGVYGSTGTNASESLYVATTARFSAGETFSMGVRQDTGAALELVGNVTYATYIEAMFMRPLDIVIGG